ncbi:Gfo/Idh/MocA family oxidoreductase [uncultured Clostridium sp.]|uniref:Gfo/Idh/MocA family protein n=1 Tax=uncultured Clostridium sp. TaxID=59620 RepID=UPI0025D887CE|nr:Gfo/Idh/MocA family oxidoreductase [uncultured Clostridium sp.]
MIKLGIIAPGTIANAFAKEIDNSKNGKVVAVYGRNQERTKSFSEKYNIQKYYTDIDKFLNDDNIEAVYIATPHNYHVEYAKKCIEAKKHILCEKPFSYNYKTSKEVLDLAKNIIFKFYN